MIYERNKKNLQKLFFKKKIFFIETLQKISLEYIYIYIYIYTLKKFSVKFL